MVNFAFMKIEQYISQLLYRYQCVTVPGFGAFLTEIQSAQVQESSHSFFPPKKLISFNSYLKNNDGLLANHIAQSEKMSYEVAVSIIENQVSSWKLRLQELGNLSLKNIGEIVLNSEKNLVFTPYEQTNYHTDSFGLSAFVSPAVKREIYKHELEQLEEKAPIILNPEERKSSAFLKYAAVFVLGLGTLGAGGYFGNEYYQNKITQETLLVETKVQKQVDQKIQEATFFIENPLTTNNTETIEIANQYPYHVVAGVYTKEYYAIQHLEELKKLGYDAKRLPTNKYGRFQLVYGSYTSREEAENAMKIIQKEHNPEAWVMIQE